MWQALVRYKRIDTSGHVGKVFFTACQDTVSWDFALGTFGPRNWPRLYFVSGQQRLQFTLGHGLNYEIIPDDRNIIAFGLQVGVGGSWGAFA